MAYQLEPILSLYENGFIIIRAQLDRRERPFLDLLQNYNDLEFL